MFVANATPKKAPQGSFKDLKIAGYNPPFTPEFPLGEFESVTRNVPSMIVVLFGTSFGKALTESNVGFCFGVK